MFVSDQREGFLSQVTCFAAFKGHIDIVKFLLSFTGDLNSPPLGIIHMAAINGHTDILKLLAPLTKHPNKGTYLEKTPMQWAEAHGHHEFARLLQSLISSGHF